MKSWCKNLGICSLFFLVLGIAIFTGMAQAKDEHPIFDAIVDDKEKLLAIIEKMDNLEMRNKLGETPLLTAARLGQWDSFMVLLENGADINAKDNKNKSVSMELISSLNSLEDIKGLFAKMENPWGIDDDGKSVLHYAASFCKEDTFQFAIDSSANIDLKDNNGDTPFSLASSMPLRSILFENGADIAAVNNRDIDIAYRCKIRHGSTDIFEFYPFVPAKALNREFQKKKKDRSREEIIWEYIDKGRISEELADEFIQLGLNANQMTISGKTVLNVASNKYKESFNLVQKLINYGADIHYLDYYGRNAMFGAVNNRSVDLVKFLIIKGIDINHTDKLGQTPLFFACKNNDLEIAKILIENGANVSQKDIFGETPLFWVAFTSAKKTDLMDFLIQHGAEVNVISNAGITPLWCAIKKQNISFINFLLKKGAIVDYFTHHSLVQESLFNNSLVNVLVSRGINVDSIVNVNIKTQKGTRTDAMPLLCWAVYNNKKEIAETIIKFSPNLNLQSDNGKTALHYAVLNNYDDLARLLIDNGTDLTIKDNFGKTALIQAALNCNTDIVQYLLKNNAKITEKEFSQFIRGNSNLKIMKKRGIYDLLDSAKLLESSI